MGKEVATTILEQLGGNKFVVMTGSKDFGYKDDRLMMRLARNKSKANMLWITLDHATDTYTMRFWKFTAPRLNHKTFEFTKEKITEVAEYKGVYCDMLQDIFTEVTGLYTHF